ncbi:hypothetical protein AVEN_148603-1 [Araneus ventricosus]|uniref:Uncharacterized protein n=1 Tax=Araneus ventricosus TaxID=182803 RepID=A0A4Y2PN94_ARAVE|nr:hypothetical protein AVEN_148603-1 [Araneus ventricosus]
MECCFQNGLWLGKDILQRSRHYRDRVTKDSALDKEDTKKMLNFQGSLSEPISRFSRDFHGDSPLQENYKYPVAGRCENAGMIGISSHDDSISN